MTPAEFAAAFVEEKRLLLRSYFAGTKTAVGADIKALGLAPEKRKALRSILDAVLTDAFYTVLLALDGAGSLGGEQVSYSLRDEHGNELTGGEIEGEAWEQFHGGDPRTDRSRA